MVDDAAGLVEVMTGEGIYYAVRSGQMAARSVISGMYEDYEARVDRELMPDLLIARHWAAIYRWLPVMCYMGPLHSQRAWRAACRLLRGECQISEFKRRLGLLGKLFELLSIYA